MYFNEQEIHFLREKKLYNSDNIDSYNKLALQGRFTASDIITLLKQPNNLNSLKALQDLLQQLTSTEGEPLSDSNGNPITPLSTLNEVGFTNNTIVRVLKHCYGSMSLDALVNLVTLAAIRNFISSYNNAVELISRLANGNYRSAHILFLKSLLEKDEFRSKIQADLMLNSLCKKITSCARKHLQTLQLNTVEELEAFCGNKKMTQEEENTAIIDEEVTDGSKKGKGLPNAPKKNNNATMPASELKVLIQSLPSVDKFNGETFFLVGQQMGQRLKSMDNTTKQAMGIKSIRKVPTKKNSPESQYAVTLLDLSKYAAYRATHTIDDIILIPDEIASDSVIVSTTVLCKAPSSLEGKGADNIVPEAMTEMIDGGDEQELLGADRKPLSNSKGEPLSPLSLLTDAGFTSDSLVSIRAQHGGSKKLKTLQGLLQPLIDSDGKPLRNSEGIQITPLNLISAEFTRDNLVHVLEKDGGSKKLTALWGLLRPLTSTDNTERNSLSNSQGIPIIPLLSLTNAGFTRDNLLSILGQYEGAKNLEALQGLLRPLIGTDRKPFSNSQGEPLTPLSLLTDAGFTSENLTCIFGQYGGSKNLEALQDLLRPLIGTDRKPLSNSQGEPLISLSLLTDAGFTSNHLVRILARRGGSKNLEALQGLLRPLIGTDRKPLSNSQGEPLTPLSLLTDAGFTSENLVRILEFDDASKNLDALFELLAVPAIHHFISTYDGAAKFISRLATNRYMSIHILFLKSLLEKDEFRSKIQTDLMLNSLCEKIRYCTKQLNQTLQLNTVEELGAFCKNKKTTQEENIAIIDEEVTDGSKTNGSKKRKRFSNAPPKNEKATMLASALKTRIQRLASADKLCGQPVFFVEQRIGEGLKNIDEITRKASQEPQYAVTLSSVPQCAVYHATHTMDDITPIPDEIIASASVITSTTVLCNPEENGADGTVTETMIKEAMETMISMMRDGVDEQELPAIHPIFANEFFVEEHSSGQLLGEFGMFARPREETPQSPDREISLFQQPCHDLEP